MLIIKGSNKYKICQVPRPQRFAPAIPVPGGGGTDAAFLVSAGRRGLARAQDELRCVRPVPCLLPPSRSWTTLSSLGRVRSSR